MSDSCFVDSETKPIIAADNHGLECLRRRQCHVCKWVPFIVVVVVVYNKGLQKSHVKLHVTLTLRAQLLEAWLALSSV